MIKITFYFYTALSQRLPRVLPDSHGILQSTTRVEKLGEQSRVGSASVIVVVDVAVEVSNKTKIECLCTHKNIARNV